MKNLSCLTIIFCLIIILEIHGIKGFYKSDDRIIESDVRHYYAWIPSILVYKDISLSFLDINPDKNKDHFITVDRTPDGKLYFKTTMGVALLQLPFILPVHYFLELTGNEADGFSMPYRIALIIGSLFYYFMGLFIIRFLVVKRMKLSDKISALTILLIGLGTNIVIYVAREPALSHVYSFFTIGLFLLITDKFYRNPKWINGALMGIVFGIITLIRPINLIVGLIPVLWGVTNYSDIKGRVLLFWKKPGVLLMIILGFIVIWTPQLMYNLYLYGNLTFHGYGTGDERFFFSNPQIINNLFSYRKGWFLYTPAMVLAVLGFISLYRNFRSMFWSILAILVILIYINSSWYSWWFGGSYGQRAYIDIYALLALPIAALLNYGFSKGLKLKIPILIIVFLLVFHNMFQVAQYMNGAIHYMSMTKAAYWDSFGKLYPSNKFKAYIEDPDYELAKKGIYPKPKKKIETRQEWIEFLETDIRTNEKAMKFFSDKAKEANLPLDTVIKQDVIYIYETSYANQE